MIGVVEWCMSTLLTPAGFVMGGFVACILVIVMAFLRLAEWREHVMIVRKIRQDSPGSETLSWTSQDPDE